MMSGKFRKALSRVPQTKPSCTAIVNQPAVDSLSPHSTRNAGTTAEALNQSDMPSSSAADRRTRARQRAGDGAAFLTSFAGWSRLPIQERRGYYKKDNRQGAKIA